MPARFLRIFDKVVEWADGTRVVTLARPVSAGAQLLGAIELDEIAAWIADQHFARGPVTLVIPSSWCLIHTVHPAVRRPDHVTLCYEFEAAVPWSAEKLTIDFIRLSNGGHLGVAVRSDDLRPLIAALDQAGLSVERITLDVFDAQASVSEASAPRLMWCDAFHVAILDCDRGGILGLRCVRTRAIRSADDYSEFLENLIFADVATIVVGRIQSDWLDRVRERVGNKPQTTVAHRAIPSIAAFNLARDSMRPQRVHSAILRSGRRCAMAVIVAGLVSVLALLLHSRQLRSELDAISQWEQAQFRELFPDQPIPGNIALRISSERRRLEGLTGSGNAQAMERFDAIASLAQFMKAIPAALKLDIDELRMSERGLVLRGRMLDHRGGEQMAAAFTEIPGVSCPAPRTERQSDGTVRFALNAQLATNKPLKITGQPKPAIHKD